MTGCLCVTMVGCGTNNKEEKTIKQAEEIPTLSSENEKPLTALTNIKANETFQTDKFKLSIKQIGNREEVGAYEPIKHVSPGGLLIIVRYKIENVSKDTVKAIELPKMVLANDKGMQYELDLEATDKYKEELNQEEKNLLEELDYKVGKAGYNVYEVPKEEYKNGSWYVVVNDTYKVEIHSK